MTVLRPGMLNSSRGSHPTAWQHILRRLDQYRWKCDVPVRVVGTLMNFRSRRLLASSAAIVAVLAAAAIFYASVWPGGASGQSRGSALANVLPTQSGNLSEAAATVNGHVIPRFQLETTFALAEGVAKGLALNGSPSAAPKKQKILEDLIDAELKYQEALRLGLTASEAEVTAAISQSRRGLEDPGSAAAKDFLVTYLAKTGLSYEDYWKDPRFHEVVRKTLIIGKFNDSLRSGHPDPRAAAQAVEQKVAELRSRSDIKILVPLP